MCTQTIITTLYLILRLPQHRSLHFASYPLFVTLPECESPSASGTSENPGSLHNALCQLAGWHLASNRSSVSVGVGNCTEAADRTYGMASRPNTVMPKFSEKGIVEAASLWFCYIEGLG